MMDNIAKYIYEVGQLKRVKRSGWWIVGVDNPESVAEHTFRTAIIGYLLAALAGADPFRVCTICVFHDIHETRINDLHLISKQYLESQQEHRILQEQVKELPQDISLQILSLFPDNSNNAQLQLEVELAHDADLLECMIQAIEYKTLGYKEAEDWIINCQSRLKNPFSLKLAESCLRTPPSSWWKELNK